MFEEKLNNLKELIKSSPDDMNKVLLIKDYYNIINYLYQIGKIECMNDYTLNYKDEVLYDKVYEIQSKMEINEIIKNSKKLLHIFKKILDFYHQNNFYAEYCDDILINLSDMKGVLPSFFNNFGKEFVNIYNKMIQEGRIVKGPIKNSDGICFNTMQTDLGFIVINKDMTDIDFFFSLVHEMGHIYQMYLQKAHPYVIDVNITSEVMSLTMEKLFYFFCESNNVLSDKVFASNILNHYSFLNHYAIAKTICELISDNLITDIDPYSFDVNHKSEKIKILNHITKECGYLYDCFKNINLTSIIYSVGDIISTHMFYSILNDYDKGILELKNFIINAKDYSMEEIINNYMTNLTFSYKYIDNFTNRYNEQKKIVK